MTEQAHSSSITNSISISSSSSSDLEHLRLHHMGPLAPINTIAVASTATMATDLPSPATILTTQPLPPTAAAVAVSVGVDTGTGMGHGAANANIGALTPLSASMAALDWTLPAAFALGSPTPRTASPADMGIVTPLTIPTTTMSTTMAVGMSPDWSSSGSSHGPPSSTASSASSAASSYGAYTSGEDSSSTGGASHRAGPGSPGGFEYLDAAELAEEGDIILELWSDFDRCGAGAGFPPAASPRNTTTAVVVAAATTGITGAGIIAAEEGAAAAAAAAVNDGLLPFAAYGGLARLEDEEEIDENALLDEDGDTLGLGLGLYLDLERQEEGTSDDEPLAIAPLAYGKGKRRRVTSERMREAALHNAAVDAAESQLAAAAAAATASAATLAASASSSSGGLGVARGSAGGEQPPRRRHYGSVKGVKRGKYRCKECGQLKRGHVCPFPRPGKSVPSKTREKQQAAAAAAAAAEEGMDLAGADEDEPEPRALSV